MPTYAAVEGGGTTFVVCIAEERPGLPLRILDQAEFPTRVPPSSTISQVTDWLKGREYDALGVAMFGPVDLDPESPTWGYVTTTPKPGWQNTDIMGPLLAVRPVPCCFDTDVNAPALEEFRHFARLGETSCAYVTVGTGVGVGLVVNGRCVRGLVHPEGGHIAVKKRRADDTYRGVDGVHPWCVEGQCSAVALAERAGVSQEELKNLPDDHPVWDDAAYLLGSLCATLCALLSVERIVLSGGVMLRASLFPKVRKAAREILNGYIAHPKVLTDGPDGIDGYIVPSARGNSAGLYGAIALAVEAFREAPKTSGGRARLGLNAAASTAVGSASTAASDCASSPFSPLAPAAAVPRGGLMAAAVFGAALGALTMTLLGRARRAA
mmetsp:Transcript_112439/g.324830  ORF Transcript_112439/g.324830 Transcript_112439/m.324830 type:complete len:381 (+) Transcript_112439:68-1210(+)